MKCIIDTQTMSVMDDHAPHVQAAVISHRQNVRSSLYSLLGRWCFKTHFGWIFGTFEANLILIYFAFCLFYIHYIYYSRALFDKPSTVCVL